MYSVHDYVWFSSHLDPNNITNYCPIKKLPFLAKIIEKAVTTYFHSMKKKQEHPPSGPWYSTVKDPFQQVDNALLTLTSTHVFSQCWTSWQSLITPLRPRNLSKFVLLWHKISKMYMIMSICVIVSNLAHKSTPGAEEQRTQRARVAPGCI